jgi:DNA modification methylase
MNRLYFGDNLEIMKRMYYQEHQKEFIDLIYIDPPFNSKRNYNVLFESVEMDDTKAQKEAFADTWSNVGYIDTLNEIKEIDLNLFNFLNALDNINISKSAISYLATMGIRIWYMHKLLKPTGSFYLHCDPTMSHYLKIECDLIFGEKNFRNEIIWKRSTSGSSKSIAQRFGSDHDVIFYFAKSEAHRFNKIYLPYPKSEIDKRFKKSDEKGRYKDAELATYSQETLEQLIAEDRLIVNPGGKYRYKIYLDKIKGVIADDIWTDIFPINSMAMERLGYPTQKPEALMERIIKASTNEGDLVADFFCGCGTTIAAAQKLNRNWIGSDISHLAVKLISKRLVDTYGENVKNTFEINGFPKDLDSAHELASGVKGGRLLFEEWIVEVELHGILNEKRNTMGYDGHFTFDMNGIKNVSLIEVKSGGASPTQLNHFVRTVEDRKAQMGIFVCFAEEVTDSMRRIAKKQGLFMEGFPYEKIQILTVQDILEGKRPNRPASRTETFGTPDRAPTRDEAIKAKKIISDAQQQKLEL